MNLKQFFGFYLICLMLCPITYAAPSKQRGLQRKLNALEIETRRENLNRREEIDGLYAIMERIEERINNTIPATDMVIDESDAEQQGTGNVVVDDKNNKKVLEEFFYLKQGMRDEKRLAYQLHSQVVKLNTTVIQRFSQLEAAIAMFNHSLEEVKTNIQNLESGQDEMRTAVGTFQKDLERQADETKRLIMKLEMGLKELNQTKVNKEPEYASCLEHLKNGHTVSGVYKITVPHPESFKVYCDQTTNGGGWTVFFKRRVDGSDNFHRSWAEYEFGFGDLQDQFWLGNDKIHTLLTLHDHHELRIDMKDRDRDDKKVYYGRYGIFMVGQESEKYFITVGNFSGNIRDPIVYRINGEKFSAKDQNNDTLNLHCGQGYRGRPWHCHHANAVRDGIDIILRASSSKYIIDRKLEMKFREVY